jgi:hypothetical protein
LIEADWSPTSQVYLPAISGHVPPQMVRAISRFMEFCYLVRRSTIDEDTLAAIDTAVIQFHQERAIFQETGVRPDGFSLPRQHSMVHYRHLIQEFGAPNGLCSSITESKHIKDVKQPWRRTSHFEALSQMLVITQRLEQLRASRVDFEARGMLLGPRIPLAAETNGARDDEDDDCGGIDDPVPDILGEVTLARKPSTLFTF